MFEKRDDFPFYVNRISYLDSNMSQQQSFSGKTFNLLLIRMKKQGRKCTCVISLLKKMGNTSEVKKFQNFADTANKIISAWIYKYK